MSIDAQEAMWVMRLLLELVWGTHVIQRGYP